MFVNYAADRRRVLNAALISPAQVIGLLALVKQP